jgi:large subunit ribosomal protein L21
MYAIVVTGGKQYIVHPGDQVKVEKIEGEPGSQIKLDRVLAVKTDEDLNLGSPTVDAASVQATIVRTAKDRKIVVFKKKRRQGYHKKQGHRQWFTLLRIDSVNPSGVEQPAVAEQPAVETENSAVE